MKALYKIRQINKRMFHRVFITYSVVIFLAMAALFLFLSEYYADFIIQREVDRQSDIVDDLKDEIQEKHDFVRQGVRQLYQEERLIEDVAFALQHSYEEYLRYRLDRFSESDSFVPYHFDIFVENYFSRDEEAIAVQIRNENLGTEYVYLYDHTKWNLEMEDQQERPIKEYADEPPPGDMLVISEQINDPVSMDRLGEMLVYFSYDNLDRLLSLQDSAVSSSYVIMNENKDIFYQNGQDTEILIEEVGFQAVETQIRPDDTYYLQSSIDPVSGLMVASLVPEAGMAQLFTYRTTILLIISLLTFLAIGLPYWTLRSYSHRVDLILSKMREVQSGQLDARIEKTRHQDDLSVISDTFNETLDELNDYIHKVYFSRLKQKEAELANLQAQINPHFLYNTLEAIRMKSLKEGARTSSKMIVQLAKLFRYSLKSEELVSVENECNHAREYINLFKARFENLLHADFTIEAGLSEKKMPPFILQPLIENYLIHGFDPGKTDNRLSVDIKSEEQYLRIMICDNGKGISAEKLREIHERLKDQKSSSDSIGLGNVHERIQLKFGKTYGVEVNSEQGVKTVIHVTLPILTGGNSDV
ncbi:sensor histidine kinase [Jeotgalibacillus haloalkalitolerans]|uniref:Sensor histidine kinase n=1 Tax=Jeotgalibacillus haloalkalitolerans TaxID=3104292 RepID=A0ABU5KJS6_9BACL|nr:sensor histidine kinase [Jeotgalibacillus sp. HH7-29]MDZ5711422.1 sensor histidine kinase [Jeotgalibacillus sp. HH7-29]